MSMGRFNSVLESITETIADYRQGEIETTTPAHVETWVKQFDRAVRESILVELDYVLKKTYIPKSDVKKFLYDVLKSEELSGTSPKSFWRNAKLLNIQSAGNSQRDMLKMFYEALRKEHGLKESDCGQKEQIYLYLDDAVFTGNRVLNDLRSWISTSAPQEAEVHIMTIAFHRGGKHYAHTGICKAADVAGKKIGLTWWRILEIEDRKHYVDSSDVLRPTSIPDDPLVQSYVSNLKYIPTLRKPGGIGERGFFSSEEGRHLLEQEFLKAGVKIRSVCPYLNVYQRPLGNIILETLGFGSLLVTFRNCPNNCPLVFWAGDPWYPLFPRKTN